jgi:hypothetical protein
MKISQKQMVQVLYVHPVLHIKHFAEVKSRVHLRFTLRFDLQFGAYVATLTQENALPVCVTCVGLSTQSPNSRVECKWTRTDSVKSNLC